MIGFGDGAPTFVDLEDGDDVVGVMLGGDEIDDEGFVAVETERRCREHSAFHALSLTMLKDRSGRGTRFVGADNAKFKGVQEVLNFGGGGERLKDFSLLFGPRILVVHRYFSESSIF